MLIDIISPMIRFFNSRCGIKKSSNSFSDYLSILVQSLSIVTTNFSDSSCLSSIPTIVGSNGEFAAGQNGVFEFAFVPSLSIAR